MYMWFIYALKEGFQLFVLALVVRLFPISLLSEGWEGKGCMFVHVRGCAHYTSCMTCQGVAKQLLDWHPKLETADPLFCFTHTQSHTVFRKSHDLSAPPSTGKHNYRGVCLSLHPYAPSLCSHSSSSPLFSLHPVACCFRNTLKCSQRLN